MEFIVISESKIKVMMTAKDLEEFELVANELDYANTETKRMFWDVLSKAKRRTGFDTDGQKVLVQLYPSRQGGCEIFVTKIGSMYSDEYDEDLFDTPRQTLTEIPVKQRKKRPTEKRQEKLVCSFSSLSDMISLCRILDSRGYSGESSAYISEGARYYLALSEDVKDELSILRKFPFISEFAEEENPKTSEYFLKEHSRAICQKSAVGTLSKC